MKRLIAYLLTVSMLLCCCGCAAGGQKSTEPSSGPTQQSETTEQPTAVLPALDDMEAQSAELMDFSFDLLRATYESGNTLISPISILSALAMTANGAEGNTLAQIEETLGINRDALNNWFAAYHTLLQKETANKVQLANSVWYQETEGLEVSDDFLQRNQQLLGAEIFPCALTPDTASQINDWVSRKTDGMIPEIVDEIPPEAVAYLINALSFDGLWDNPYEKHAVQNKVFNDPYGTEDTGKRVAMMMGKEQLYLRSKDATGFIKPYQGRNFGFVAILPEAGMSVQEYLEETSGKELRELILNPLSTEVRTMMPIFKTDFTAELKDILAQLGIEDLFTCGIADLSGMGSHSLYVDRVMHKTAIEVNTYGTKAGAATSVTVEAKGGSFNYVYLDRPFLYMIVDLENGTPLFMGIMEDPADMAPPIEE